MYSLSLLSFRPVATGACFMKIFCILVLLHNKGQHSDALTYSYDPNDSLGPQHWPSLFPEDCGQTRKSPISLTKTISNYVKFSPLKFHNYDVVPTSGTLLNNGHTALALLEFTRIPFISGGDLPSEYQFLQYHFHWGSNSIQGSEHTLEGIEYPLELHLVHVKKSLADDVGAALDQSDGIAVLGVLFELSPFDNPILEPVIQALARIQEKDDQTTFNPAFRLFDLLPLDKSSFYRYFGSLTTPTCIETVVWTVFTSTLPVSERQLIEFRKLKQGDGNPLVDNYRPIQPRYGRNVQRNGVVKIPNLCFIPFICPKLESLLKTTLIVIRAFIGIPITIG